MQIVSLGGKHGHMISHNYAFFYSPLALQSPDINPCRRVMGIRAMEACPMDANIMGGQLPPICMLR